MQCGMLAANLTNDMKKGAYCVLSRHLPVFLQDADSGIEKLNTEPTCEEQRPALQTSSEQAWEPEDQSLANANANAISMNDSVQRDPPVTTNDREDLPPGMSLAVPLLL
jgi:hypothetical protein